jgi:protein-S-isoprenylcysteine O-methyltransferase Ste14
MDSTFKERPILEEVFPMNHSTTQHSNTEKTKLNRDGVKGIVREFIRPVIQLAILLISAGRVNWINAWVYIGVFVVIQIVFMMTLYKINPQVLNERGKVFRKNTKTFDKLFYAIGLPFGLGMLIIAGLDTRYGWSTMSFGEILLGFVIFIPAIIFGLWAMAVNSYFSVTVRIQEEREHQVCRSGPYKIVRHPGYVSLIFGIAAIPLILGSWWALAPGSIFLVLVVIRTALEDRTLQKELPGYKEYAQMTRYRLVPLVW